MGAVVAAADYRHALGGAQDISRALGDDALLAGDQCDILFALDAADALIDLAGQQPQREADDPAGMATHAFDSEVGLAGVGWPKDGPHKGVTGHARYVGTCAIKRKRQSAELNRS